MVSKKLSVIMLLSSVLITACQEDSPVTVEKLFTNGVVYTANQTQQVVTSIGITNDRLVYVGNAKDAETLIATETEIIDLNGKMIIPGLHDVHIHLADIVESNNCDLAGQAFSLTDMVPRLKQCLRCLELPDGEWLTVEQWPYYSGNEPSEIFPTIRSTLDSVSNKHPIILLADDGHHGAVNSVAMSLATDKNGLNIDLSKATLNNEFAHLKALIGIDHTGEPNGVINEDARKIV
jgi:predicted amidohydrolase YtcJ